MKWSELSSTKRDLLITIGVVNRDPDRQSSGTVVISELRDRTGRDASREAYYMALSELESEGLVDKDPTVLDGRRVKYELTGDAVRLLNQHRLELDESMRVVA